MLLCINNTEGDNCMQPIDRLIDMIRQSSCIVAFTGAGVSTESNIPDFRSSGGLYDNNGGKYSYPPEVMLSHSFFEEYPRLFFEFYKNNMIFTDARPNTCHLGLAELERMGKLKAVITQNIDGLHQAGGSRNVLELHGSVHRNYCTHCKKAYSLDYVMGTPDIIPLCEVCGGIVKPDVVLYEEMLDEEVLSRSMSSLSQADMVLVIGTSLVVYPAAGLLNYFRGSRLALINKTATPYDSKAGIVINDSAGSVMNKVMQGLQE